MMKVTAELHLGPLKIYGQHKQSFKKLTFSAIRMLSYIKPEIEWEYNNCFFNTK